MRSYPIRKNPLNALDGRARIEASSGGTEMGSPFYAAALIGAGLTTALVTGTPALAAPVTIDFDQLKGNGEAPLTYYAGGYGSEGTGPGPNYGVTFSSNVNAGASYPSGSNGVVANTPSSPNYAAYSGSQATLDDALGFTKGFSLFYSAPFVNAKIDIFSGLGGTGNLLATLALDETTDGRQVSSCARRTYCPFVEAGVDFSGIAHSAVFSSPRSAQLAFDNVTLGSSHAITSAVPEPAAWALMIMGLGAAGAVKRRRQRIAIHYT